MKQKHIKSINQNCPLDNPGIDIVPENDHLVGICLCQFCKCGKHVCPKNRHLNATFLSDSFQTTYSRQFRKGPFDVPYKIHPIPYKPNRQKMDFTTTNKVHYKASSLDSNISRRSSTITPAKKALLSTTAYKYYYPNWGKQEINYEKGWHAPVRSIEIPFRGESSYSREFIKPDLKKAQNVDPKKFTACQTTISISPRASFNPRTTYKEKMRDYSLTSLNTHVKIQTPKAKFTPATTNHFQTSAEKFFKPTSPVPIDPRKLRLSMLSRSSIS